tara:strand:- start:7066 stop:8772 length:1707 start_codon:yes stop_codon:yes gene_type:complete
MADRIESFKVICAGGLNSNENHLELSEATPGAATRLVNYEPSLFGGYRRINGYEKYDSTYPCVGDHISNTNTAEGKVLGLALYRDDATNLDITIAFRKDAGSNSYSAYKYVKYVGWVKYTFDHSITRTFTNTANISVDKIRFSTFNFGDGNKIIFVDGVNPALIFDGTEWNEVTVAGTGSSTTTSTTSPGGNQALDAPALVDVFENHIFLGGDRLYQATIAHSAPNAAHDFTVANGAGQLSVGFDVVQFKPFRDDLFIFGGNGIKKASADVNAGFVIDPVTANVGCIARDSVLEIGGDLVFLAPDGIRPVAGTSRIGDVELETISKPIHQLLKDLPVDYDLDTLNGVVVRSKSQLRYFIGDDADANAIDSFGIIGGLRSADQKLGWEFGELLGFRASCCTSGYIGRFEYVLHGDYDGNVYRQEQGNTLDGNDILSVYRTPYYDFGDTQVRKIMREVHTFIRAEGPLTLNLSVGYDWQDSNTATPADYISTNAPLDYSTSSEGAPTTYNGRNIEYGGTNVNYGGTSKPIMSTSIQGSGYASQLTFVSYGEFDPYSIQGMVFEFSVAGRR